MPDRQYKKETLDSGYSCLPLALAVVVPACLLCFKRVMSPGTPQAARFRLVLPPPILRFTGRCELLLMCWDWQNAKGPKSSETQRDVKHYITA
ncbi:hypothetical protein AVEN_95407-1 [Araneus ventricosus]|uniref:Uncharacterized protein n=1 Tax=Araneus ventricosus TaxID=182803 RepID=A0A4Y2CHU5_ARAVE|nr:hypothetical protein AVEN_95407-1 [Araneus ventricosus]